MTRLSPNQRLLLQSVTNHYTLVGPGWVWIKPWQEVVAKLYVGPQSEALPFSAVRTVENIPLDITVQLLFQVDPDLFTGDLLPKIPGLNEGGWHRLLRWRTEYLLRQMLAAWSWRDLSRPGVQQRLERQLSQTLAGQVNMLGIRIHAACMLRIGLPDNLQGTIVQAERDGIEPRGRALVLKEYFDIFSHDLAQAMPYIVQWELLNAVRKTDNAHVLLSGLVPPPDGRAAGPDPARSILQLQLPLANER